MGGLLLSAGRVVTCVTTGPEAASGDLGVVTDGAVLVSDGAVAALGPRSELCAAYPDVPHRAHPDAVITGRTDLLLTIQTADCVPLLLHDRRTGALAAVHAGWRGTAKRIAAATLEAMARAYDTRASDVNALIGPAIGPCCFEVGDEVLQALERATLGAGARAGTTAKNRPTVDLWRANALALREAGVGAESIHTLALCTHCRVDLFPSFRRGDTGRMYAFVGRLS